MEIAIAPFYWFVFPFIFIHVGYVFGTLVLIVFQYYLFHTAISRYDIVGDDIWGIESGMSALSGWLLKWVHPSLRWFVIMIAIMFVFSPPVMHVYLRSRRINDDNNRDGAVLLGIVALKTLGWLVLDLCLIILWHWFRH